MNTGMQYDAKELAVLTTSLMKVIRQQLEKCAAYFQVCICGLQPFNT